MPHCGCPHPDSSPHRRGEGRECAPLGYSANITPSVPALVAGIQRKASSRTRCRLDPEDKPRDDIDGMALSGMATGRRYNATLTRGPYNVGESW
jgi:hypothetical protein